MPRNKITEVFLYSELEPDAQSTARDWYRGAISGDNDFAEFTTEDFKEVLTAGGFELDRKYHRDALYWSGFSHQGQGACFGASWSARNVNVLHMIPGRPVSWTDGDGKVTTCTGNAELVPILKRIAMLALKYPHAHGEIIGNDRYGFSTKCERAVESAVSEGENDSEIQDELTEIATDLAHYFYRALEQEYEYQTSDEQIAEAIDANGYEFTSNGKRA